MECAPDRQQGTLRLDLEGKQLWREEEALRLRPKSFAVLRYLVRLSTGRTPGSCVTPMGR
jgi:DNA-binding response OmpR family regulator